MENCRGLGPDAVDVMKDKAANRNNVEGILRLPIKS